MGFRAREPDSKYVALLNNDAIPTKDSLTKLVEFAEQYSKVGALNGVLLKYNSNLIDSAGCFVDELLLTYDVGAEEPYPWILKKPLYVSYACGAYVLYRVEHVRKCIGEKLFIDEFFGYGDDNVLGLMLWNYGYPSMSIPEVVGRHSRGMSFKRMGPLTWYLFSRNKTALALLSNSRYKKLILWHGLEGLMTSTVRRGALYRLHVKALYDGLALGIKLLTRMGRVDMYKAPIIRLSIDEVLRVLSSPRRILESIMKEKIRRIVRRLTENHES